MPPEATASRVPSGTFRALGDRVAAALRQRRACGPGDAATEPPSNGAVAAQRDFEQRGPGGRADRADSAARRPVLTEHVATSGAADGADSARRDCLDTAPVPQALCTGRACAVIWPPWRVRWLPRQPVHEHMLSRGPHGDQVHGSLRQRVGPVSSS